MQAVCVEQKRKALENQLKNAKSKERAEKMVQVISFMKWGSNLTKWHMLRKILKFFIRWCKIIQELLTQRTLCVKGDDKQEK